MTNLSRYMPIGLFALITVIGLVFNYTKPNGEMWDLYKDLGTSSTLALAVLALIGYWEYVRSEDAISIFFKIGDEEKDTGITVLRKNCSRSEVMGILGMFHKRKKDENPNSRFVIEDLQKNTKILEVFDKIQTGSSKKLLIDLKEDEKDQFPSLIS